MAKVRVQWTDAQADEDGVRIYRDTSAIDPEALPTPIKELQPGIGVYEDPDVAVGTQHYYVAPFADATVGEGVAGSVDAVEELPRMIYGLQPRMTTSGTTVNVPMPECKEGDLLIIYGMRRAAMGTIPSGWTYGPVPANGSYAQWSFVLWKIADGTEYGTSVTITQASAARIGAAVAVFRHPSGPITVTSLGAQRRNGLTFSVAPIGFTNGASKALVFSCSSWVYQIGAGETYVELANDQMVPVIIPRWPAEEPTSQAQRIMAWVTEADAAEVVSSTITESSVDNASDSRTDIHLALTV